MLVLQVFIMRNGAFEGTEMVTGDRIELGRDASCAVVLDDESCSRRHAMIFEHDGKIAIQDLGSANGTRVNGEPVTSARYVGPRDDIAIGAFTLKLKLMSGQAKATAPQPVVPANNPTRVYTAPSPQAIAGIAIGKASDEATAIAPGRGGNLDAAHTEALPGISGRGSGEGTVTVPSPPPPPVPPVSDEQPLPERPTRPSGVQRPQPLPSPDVTAPEAPLPARPQPMAAQAPQPFAQQAQQLAREPSTSKPRPAVDFAIPDGAGADLPSITFAPRFLAEELHAEDDDDPPWSLVQRLVRPTQDKPNAKGNHLLEIVHYRGELVVDHTVLHEGETFRLGDRMTRAERKERGIPKAIPMVRLKKGGVAEIFHRDEVNGRLLRNGQQVDLPKGSGATPITDGELASLRVGDERVFVRFASQPQMLWTKDDAAEDRFARRLNAIAAGTSLGLFSFLAVVSWIYQYRNADQEVIALEDEGFAEVEIKELKMEEPPPEPEKPPEPIESPEPTPQEAKPDKSPPSAKPEKAAPVEEAKPAKPGVMDILNNIPKVNDTASNQNLTAALSNIKGVRVPGGAAGVKVSALIGKGPSSGVQIGGAAGGLSTSGINSLIRKDGQAGALGGKGDRAVAGKVTTLTRQVQQKGEGQLSKEEIQKVINQHIGEIQYCYEKQLRTQPGLAGRVVLEWGVNPQGKVSVVKVAQSSLQSAEATNCMMGKLKTWKFPPPRGGSVTVVFPFVFNTV
jgi:TonB family protein